MMYDDYGNLNIDFLFSIAVVIEIFLDQSIWIIYLFFLVSRFQSFNGYKFLFNVTLNFFIYSNDDDDDGKPKKKIKIHSNLLLLF